MKICSCTLCQRGRTREAEEARISSNMTAQRLLSHIDRVYKFNFVSLFFSSCAEFFFQKQTSHILPLS